MKLGLIQASSQKEKNKTLEHYLNEAINSNDELINIRSLDFVVAGCTSGQGMMPDCNPFPNIQCGYLPPPARCFSV